MRALKDTKREFGAKLTAAIIVIGLATVLCGCAQRWEPDLDPNIMACKSYGFYEGSPEFDQCMKYVEGRRSKRAP
jgi:hypothetical protein